MADLHPAVAAVLAVMPIDDEGETVVGFHRDNDGLMRGLNRDGVMEEMLLTTWGPPGPQAARYAVALLRWLDANAETWVYEPGSLAALVAEIEAFGAVGQQPDGGE